MEQVIFGGYDDILKTTSTGYNSLVGGYYWVFTEAGKAKIVSTDGVIKHLRVKLDGSPGVGKKYTFTLMLNGSPTALTFDISDLETSGSNMVNEVVVTGGDTVSLRCVPDGTPTARYATWSSVFEGDNDNESLILGGTSDFLHKTNIEYGQVMCAYTLFYFVESRFRQVVPTSGTIKKFYVQLSEDPGRAGDAYRFTLRKNGVSTSLTVTITEPDTTGNDLINNVAVVAGDVLTLMIEPLNNPQKAPYPVWGMTFVADIDGESIVLGGSDYDLDAAVTRFRHFTSSETVIWSLNETLTYQLGQVCTLKKLHILLSGSPGAGNKYDFTIRIAGADSNVVATVADAATTGNSGALEDTVSLDEYVNLKVVPDDSPTSVDAYWGLVCVCVIGEPYAVNVRLIGTVIPLYKAQGRIIGLVYRSYSAQVRNIGKVVFPYSSRVRLIGVILLPFSTQVRNMGLVFRSFSAQVRNIGKVVFPYSSRVRLIGTIHRSYSAQVRNIGSVYQSYSSSVRNIGILTVRVVRKCHAELSVIRRRIF